MYPTITDLINDIFGINIPLPIQTFGFFMALGFATAYFYLKFAMNEKTKQGIFKIGKVKHIIGGPAHIGEIISNAIFGLILGWKFFPAIQNYSAFVNDPQSFILSWKGNIPVGILIALVFGFFTWFQKHRKRLDSPKTEIVDLLPKDLVGDILGIAALSGVVGAKLLSSVEDWKGFINDPIGSIFSFSGLTWYGGLIFGTIAVVWYVRKRSNMINLRHMADVAAPAIIIGYSVGRLGCHFSGDGDWGIVNSLKKPLEFLPDWLWAYNYPNNVIRECASHLKDGTIVNADCIFSKTPYLIAAVWPTPVFEFLIGSTIFLILLSLRNRLKFPGLLFAVMLIFNGLERYFVEVWRINERYAYGLSLSQFIAIGLILLGIIGIVFFRSTGKKVELNS